MKKQAAKKVLKKSLTQTEAKKIKEMFSKISGYLYGISSNEKYTETSRSKAAKIATKKIGRAHV